MMHPHRVLGSRPRIEGEGTGPVVGGVVVRIYEPPASLVALTRPPLSSLRWAKLRRGEGIVD